MEGDVVDDGVSDLADVNDNDAPDHNDADNEGDNDDKEDNEDSPAAVVPTEPYPLGAPLDSIEVSDFKERCDIHTADCKQWIKGDDAAEYTNGINLVFMDPPWSVLSAKSGSLRADDRLYESDIPAICDYIGKCLVKEGTALVRMKVQDWNVWEDAMKRAHLKVEAKPLIVAKDPSRCAQVQGRWKGRTACYSVYMVAHAQNRGYGWNRSASGFLPRNQYGPSAAMINGVSPPKRKDRLLDHNGDHFRPQVRVAYTCAYLHRLHIF